MPNFTPNLNLEKPLTNEFYDINIFNSNADKLDSAIYNATTNSYQKPTDGIPFNDLSAEVKNGLDRYGVASGVNNMTLSVNPVVVNLYPGLTVRFKSTSNGTGPVSININGLGYKNILKNNGSPFNNSKENAIYTITYDGANFILQGEGSGGNALSAEILSGRTATTDNGEITGTMPNRGNFNLGLGSTVLPGYYSGGSVPNGKYSFQGQSILTNDNGYSLINVTGLNFSPSVVIVNFFYGSNFHIKCFGLTGSTNDITFGSSGLVYNEGGWSVGNGFFRTRLSNSIAHIGVNANWIAYS